jgi:ATP-dependent DNA helicase RecG
MAMMIDAAKIDEWRRAKESERLEFKEAKNRYDFEKLVRYCAALANEGGGHFVLGVSDRVPRRVVGTSAFKKLERTKAGIIERLHIRVDVAEVHHPEGRVLVFDVPDRPLGMPVQYKGAYWMRGGEDLVPMTPDRLKAIFEETQPDFSAQICSKATLADLEPVAIAEFRRRWMAKSRRQDLSSPSGARLLEDAELLLDGGVTYAALVLFGSHRALGRHLAQAELVFEYRSDESSIPYQQRQEYRTGLFLFFDDLWKVIDARNDLHSFQEGLFRYELPAFNEEAVRESILNAVSHRDYRLAGSTFVRQFPTKLEVVNPGGFPPGITPENILYKQAPRNRRIAEALARCGLVERSGQGADRMFGAAIREGKLPPDFRGTDAYQVAVTLNGSVQDRSFLVFLERLTQERQTTLHIDDLLVLDAVHRQIPIPGHVVDRIARLVDLGALERVGHGRGAKCLLSRRYYTQVGKPGMYTRKRGLDRETNKALLRRHLADRRKHGAQLDELTQVLPALSRQQVQVLLREMKRDRLIHNVGRTKGARWYPGPSPEEGQR